MIRLMKAIYRSMWVLSKNNPKTGVCIAQYVGCTDDECMESCWGCLLLATRHCYAHFASFVRVSHIRMIACMNSSNGKKYTLEEVSQDRFFQSARFVRLGARGDPARSEPDTVQGIDFASTWNLPLIGYTHFPEEIPHLKHRLMASTSDWDEADSLIADGWHVAMDHEFPITGMKTDAGHSGVWCPYESTGGKVTCGQCLLCCVKDTTPKLIFFKHKLPIWERKRGKEIATDSGTDSKEAG